MQGLLGFLRANAWMLIVVGGVVAALFWLVDPAPPRVLTIATGVEGGAYHAFGERLASRLEQEGLEVRLEPSNGSIDNLRRLRDPDGRVDLALVQTGIASDEDRESGLRALGSLFFEPVWIFTPATAPLATVQNLRGRRIAVGIEGSGTLPVAREVLAANGLSGAYTPVLIGGREAADALAAGDVDAAILVGSPESPIIRELLESRALVFHGLRRGRAYESRFPRLATLTIGEGQLDLAANLPGEDRVVLAAAVTLVVSERFHPGLTPLVLGTANDLLRNGGLLERPGEFPAERPTDFALLPEAEHYHRHGPPFLMRQLPFWAATVVFRTIILVIPLLAVLIPLLRIAPPIYVWRTRKKIYRWYQHLRDIDQRLQSGRISETLERDLEGLRKLEDEILEIKIPLSYADELYDLHLHIEWVIRRLERQRAEASQTGSVAS